eukprot:5723949-Ditylum_brightwellii.AAC.1
MLRYGISQLVITDADSKFKGEFKEAMEILKIKHHMVSKGNHNAVMVERFNVFLNSSLTAFTNDRQTNRLFVDGTHMSVYGWSSAPVVGTDISRSLLVVRREYSLPIDYTSRSELSFNVTPLDVKSYANKMLNLLDKCRFIFKMLISEQRTLHRDLRNEQLNEPKRFQLGDVVFARVQIQSKKSEGKVKKLSYKM